MQKSIRPRHVVMIFFFLAKKTWDIHGIFMGYSWDIHGILMGYGAIHGIFMVNLLMEDPGIIDFWLEKPEANRVFRGTSALPSGYVKHSYGKWPFIVDFPIKNGDFP